MTEKQAADIPSSDSSEGRKVTPLDSPVKLFTSAWALYKKRFVTLLSIDAVMLGVIIAAGAFGGVALSVLGSFEPVLIFAVVFLIVITVITTWALAAQITVLKNPHLGVWEAYRESKAKVASLWWALLLLVFTIIGGFFLFLIPGILFMVWFTFVPFVVLLEDVSGLGALLRSREYVRNHWLGVFGRLLPVYTAYWLLGLLPTLIRSLTQQEFVAGVVGLLVTLLVPLFILCYTYLFYTQLKTQKTAVKVTGTKKRKALYIVPAGIGALGLAAFISFLPVYFFLVRPFAISGDAMSPTYKNGEYVITNLTAYWNHPPQRGDILIFRAPDDPEKKYVKRVIAVPGERVKLEDGNVFINGKRLYEPYLKNVKTYGGSFLQEKKEIAIPQGYYFVLGDNRMQSYDSREYGLVPQTVIISNVLFCYWNCPK